MPCDLYVLNCYLFYPNKFIISLFSIITNKNLLTFHKPNFYILKPLFKRRFMLADTFSRFRLISFIEGISYLLLLFIAMPLKYIFDYPIAVKIVGMAHGVLFILFFIALIMVANKYKWKFLTFQLFVYSLIPFGFILIEKIIMKTPPKKL